MTTAAVESGPSMLNVWCRACLVRIQGQPGLTLQPAVAFWAGAPHRCGGWRLRPTHQSRCQTSCWTLMLHHPPPSRPRCLRMYAQVGADLGLDSEHEHPLMAGANAVGGILPLQRHHVRMPDHLPCIWVRTMQTHCPTASSCQCPYPCSWMLGQGSRAAAHRK